MTTQHKLYKKKLREWKPNHKKNPAWVKRTENKIMRDLLYWRKKSAASMINRRKNKFRWNLQKKIHRAGLAKCTRNKIIHEWTHDKKKLYLQVVLFDIKINTACMLSWKKGKKNAPRVMEKLTEQKIPASMSSQRKKNSICVVRANFWKSEYCTNERQKLSQNAA